MELNKKLVALRKKKGMTQEELAEAIKVSRQAISRWEVGTALPSADNLMWLSKFYEVAMDELMGDVTSGEQESSEGKKATNIKNRVFQKFFAIACVLILIVIIMWAISSMSQREEIGIVDLNGLESETYLPSNVIDMDIKFGNS